MRKKILYINYMLQFGHVNFDQIHISALIEAGNDVHIIIPEEIKNRMPFENSRYKLIIPTFLSKERKGAFLTRLFLILSLFYIKIKINFTQYNLVLISNTDEITLGLIPLCKRMGLICHANAGNFHSRIKRYFLKKLSKTNFFIVFNNRMKKPFIEHGINNVFCVSHGCVPPFSIKNKVTLPYSRKNYDMIIFHPSSKCDDTFVSALHKDKEFTEMIRKEKILLILRGKKIYPDSHNIITITDKLSIQSFQSIFLSSDIILLAYPETFKYQVSGISYECIANQKRMLIHSNPSLEYCRNYFNYDPMFNDTKELYDKIYMLKNKEEHKCIVTSADLAPDYSQILDYVEHVK